MISVVLVNLGDIELLEERDVDWLQLCEEEELFLIGENLFEEILGRVLIWRNRVLH